jgi:cytochrome c biogenesis protein CcmG/thiol:disulfide interchange protein DsbE
MKILPTLMTATLLLVVPYSPSHGLEKASATVPRLGVEFPGFVLPDTENMAVALSDFRGKAILLSFWSCYTDTCYTSVRVIEALLKEYGSLGLVAPTVCSEVPPALAKNSYAELLKRCGTGQIVLIDRDMELTERLGIREFPTTYLIDKNHTIYKVIVGVPPLMEEEFRALVRFLVIE